MFKTLFDFILNRKGHSAQQDTVAKSEAPVAPYKVETPAVEAPATKVEPVKCGCGRSPSGYCVGLHSLTAEEWNAHPANPVPVVVAAAPEAKPVAKAKPAPKVGKTAAKAAKAADAKKKPAAMKAPAKPRAKKAKE